jgi:hypothetical protein
MNSNDLIIDMELKDFRRKYPNKSLMKINNISYDDIIDTIVNEYKKKQFYINIDIISNIPNIDIRTNDEVWENLIKIENLIFVCLFHYFNLLSIDIIKSFIFLYYTDIFDCLQDYTNNNNGIDIKNSNKKQFYLKLITFTIYFNTNIFNDVYHRIKEIIINNTLIYI